jgi:Protein of unknown function (DUF4239)
MIARRTPLRTILQLVTFVFACMVISVAGLAVVDNIFSLQVLQANNDIAGNYLQTVGTVYAVLLAFVVFVVWTQYNETCKMVEREADGLIDVLRFIRTRPDAERWRLTDAARNFISEQIRDEWPLMARKQGCRSVARLLDVLWENLTAIEPNGCREESLYAEAITRFNDVCDARTDLIHSSRVRLPPTMWALVISGGCGTVMSMYLFGLKNFWSLAIMTASLAGCVSFILYVIYDLDNPFDGDWQVEPEPLQEILDQLEEEIAARNQVQTADSR